MPGADELGTGSLRAVTRCVPDEEQPEDALELHEMAYGPGSFFPLDSDDIDEMIASGQA
jgi:hypothetical protein